ncbi:MAG: NAD(P)H-dependent oxidoreductase subunit E [Eggerthellaceae bacterium]|nr:NAD(P)H-dependent oxidoreductase subunit E [Eggerthellaceae bacterium]
MSKTLTQEEKLAIIEDNGGRQENILNILLALQDASGEGCIDQETSAIVAKRLSMTETKVYEIASFYSMVNTSPQAQHVLEICNSSPCFFSKSDEVAQWVEGALGVKACEATPDGMFSFGFTPCVGACDIGPVIKVKDTVYGNLTQDKVKALIEGLREGSAGL